MYNHVRESLTIDSVKDLLAKKEVKGLKQQKTLEEENNIEASLST